jgi:hypothetical protein
VDDERGRIKRGIIAACKVLFQYFRGRTEENHKTSSQYGRSLGQERKGNTSKFEQEC